MTAPKTVAEALDALNGPGLDATPGQLALIAAAKAEGKREVSAAITAALGDPDPSPWPDCYCRRTIDAVLAKVTT